MTKEEYAEKWAYVYPPHKGAAARADFIADARRLTGAWMNDAAEAARIEDWDFNLVIDRLRGKRPPEWQLKIDALEQRVKRIEEFLSL